MAISERERRDAYTGLEQALGENIANTIMQLLPNQPADQLVTRTDMHAFGTELRGEMAELRGELRGEMAELRGEVRGDIARLDAKIIELGGDLRAEISQLRNHTTRMMSGAIAANAVALVGVLVA
ncbi:MAG: hypothetical protein R8J94_21790 [Acidimicrobiia bacterium]|nr:hypothetical protein [Acidimicrobiia bacterium]